MSESEKLAQKCACGHVAFWHYRDYYTKEGLSFTNCAYENCRCRKFTLDKSKQQGEP